MIIENDSLLTSRTQKKQDAPFRPGHGWKKGETRRARRAMESNGDGATLKLTITPLGRSVSPAAFQRLKHMYSLS